MTDKRAKGNRNLLILNWMGLTSQACGVVFAFGSFASLFGSADDTWRGIISGLLCVVFGMALSGWAGNLTEITNLKYRVSELEKTASPRMPSVSNDS